MATVARKNTGSKVRKASGKKSTTRRSTKRASAVTVQSYMPSEEEIRVRAYQIFLERGAQHGHDLDDWLAAENELRSKIN